MKSREELRDDFAMAARVELSDAQDMGAVKRVAHDLGIECPPEGSDGPAWMLFWDRVEAVMRYNKADTMLAVRDRRYGTASQSSDPLVKELVEALRACPSDSLCGKWFSQNWVYEESRRIARALAALYERETGEKP
jgi:hypothetical protein